MTARLGKYEKTLLCAAMLALGCLGVVIWDQEIQWRMREDYRFGYLVPVFFVYVLHERWRQIRQALFERKTSAFALRIPPEEEAAVRLTPAANLSSAPPALNESSPSPSPLFAVEGALSRPPDLFTASSSRISGDEAGMGDVSVPPAGVPAWRGWDWLVSAMLYVSLPLFVLGAAMRAINGPNIFATYFNTGGFIGIAAAGLWFFSERDAFGHPLMPRERVRFLSFFTFPVLVWLVSGPLLYLLDTSIRTYLLVRVGIIVASLLQGIGMDVTACQGIITLPRILPDGSHDIVGVSDACSGVRSLTACIFMGAFLSATFVQGHIRKLLLLVLSLVFAVVLNLIRTTFLTMWAFKNGSKTLDYDLWLHPASSPDYTLGNVHDIAGYTAMGLTFLVLLAVLPLVNLRLRLRRPAA